METTAVCDIRLKENATMIDGAKFNYDYSSLEKSYSDIFHSGAMVDGVYHYSKYEDLLENDTLDILFVCLPNYLASEVTIAALERGLHVFCEKPPGRTVEDILNVIKVEKEHP